MYICDNCGAEVSSFAHSCPIKDSLHCTPCAPAQEEEEMGVVRKGCFCEICSKQLTLTNGKEHVCHECYNRANAESQKDTADLRQLHRDAALAALSGAARNVSDNATTRDVEVCAALSLLIADEFVRQYNPDAVIAEVVG